jgi:hypothetical protein
MEGNRWKPGRFADEREGAELFNRKARKERRDPGSSRHLAGCLPDVIREWTLSFYPFINNCPRAKLIAIARRRNGFNAGGPFLRIS